MLRKITKTVGFLGCGNMGEAILSGMLAHHLINKAHVLFHEVDKHKAGNVKRKYGVHDVSSVAQLFSLSEIVILAVKPQTLSQLKDTISALDLEGKLIISILAGTPVSKLKKIFKGATVVRVMPNLGAMLGEGITAVAMDKHIDPSEFSVALKIFSSCGDVVQLPERLFNVVTAVSGSGPAYFFYLTELLVANAVAHGIPVTVAEKLSVCTVSAAASMMKKTGVQPAQLRTMVTSKGGTTEAALKAMYAGSFDGIFAKAISAAIDRGKELEK